MRSNTGKLFALLCLLGGLYLSVGFFAVMH